MELQAGLMSKPLLLCVVGRSGSGKTSLVEYLANHADIPTVVSYTTRPMREGEQDGREHWFVGVDRVPTDGMVAYTKYGGHYYWTEESQFKHSLMTYVIDEAGLAFLREHYGDKFCIRTIYIDRPLDKTIPQVGKERAMRELLKEADPKDYNLFIGNRGDDMDLFLKNACRVVVRALPLLWDDNIHITIDL